MFDCIYIPEIAVKKHLKFKIFLWSMYPPPLDPHTLPTILKNPGPAAGHYVAHINVGAVSKMWLQHW